MNLFKLKCEEKRLLADIVKDKIREANIERQRRIDAQRAVWELQARTIMNSLPDRMDRATVFDNIYSFFYIEEIPQEDFYQSQSCRSAPKKNTFTSYLVDELQKLRLNPICEELGNPGKMVVKVTF